MDKNPKTQDQQLPHKPLGLGLIGAGAFGRFCLKAFSRMEEITVVAVADEDLNAAQTAAPSEAMVYQNLSELLKDDQVDIVAINTPPFLHGMMIISSAEAGKHIFVEKPLAVSLAEAQEAVSAARSAGVQLGIDYVLRHHALHRLAAEVIHSQVLGNFQYWSLENFAADDDLPPQHWFWDQSKSGGILVEHGVHFFDLCNYFVGKAPNKISGFELRRPDGRVDRAGTTLRYGDDVFATFYHSFNQPRRSERAIIRLGFSRGQILLEGWIPTRITLEGFVTDDAGKRLSSLFAGEFSTNDHSRDIEASDSLQLSSTQDLAKASFTKFIPDRQLEYQKAIQMGVRNLAAAIHGKDDLEVTAEQGLVSLAIALQARESSQSRDFDPPLGAYSNAYT